jgi:hypothetical protein
MDGETVIDPTIVSRLVGRRRRQDPLAVLSERERQVLGLGRVWPDDHRSSQIRSEAITTIAW